MAGKSKSKSNSKATSQATTNTMNNLKKGAVSNEKVAGMQQDLANTQMQSVGGGLGAMIEDAMGMFGENPMMSLMGGMMGLPVQLKAPDALQEFIDKYRPQEDAAPQQPQVAQQPQQGMNVAAAAPGMDQYGRPIGLMNGRNMY